MRRLVTRLRLILLLGAVMWAGCASRPQAADLYLVTRIVDGDTFIARTPEGKSIRCRLRRLNAPELDEPGGPEARDALRDRLLGNRVRLTIHAHDVYGRSVVSVR